MTPSGGWEAGRFRVGDRVTVRQDSAGGANPRTPRYVRGKTGSVTASYGVIHNPLDHRDPYPALYTVTFEVAEVSGRPGHDQLSVDLHEDWLDPAGPAETG